MDSTELQAQLERCHRASYGWALSCCAHDASEAESVLQSVYVKVLEGKARYDGRAAFQTWLFAIIRNTAADQRRWRLLHKLRLIKYHQQQWPLAIAAHPDESIYRSQVRDWFRQALARLPARQREVLQLVFYHDMSLQEAAKVMDVSLGAARTHYERGKKQLRSWLTELGETDGTAGRETEKIISATER